MTDKRFTLKEIDNYNHGKRVTDIILDEGIELPQSTACDLLNEQLERIDYLEKNVSFYKKAYEDYKEEVNILHMELINAKSKGYQLSDSFTKYMMECNEKEIERIKELIK